jgi:hypothetical protein
MTPEQVKAPGSRERKKITRATKAAFDKVDHKVARREQTPTGARLHPQAEEAPEAPEAPVNEELKEAIKKNLRASVSSFLAKNNAED